MRALCSLLDEAGLGREALLRLGRRAARAEAALAARTPTVAAALAPAREPGRFRANVASLAHEPEEIFLRVLDREIVALGDQTRRLRLERLETLALADAERASRRRAVQRHPWRRNALSLVATICSPFKPKSGDVAVLRDSQGKLRDR